MEDILEKIYTSGLKLLVPVDVNEVYKIIVGEAIKLTDADSGSIHLEVEGEFKVVYATNPSFYNVKPRKKANTYKAFITQKPVIADISDVGKAHPQIRNMGIRSALFIPLSYQKKSIGVLVVNKKTREYFDQDKMRILTLFGAMASLAIRKNQLFDETKKALETRDLFISMAAHELRTPLTSISGYAQLLCSRLSTQESAESGWSVQLKWETTRLTNLVNELLAIDRIKSGQLEYVWKECSLPLVIQRAIDNYRFISPEREIIFDNNLRSDQLDIVIGDFDKLLQVIDRLIENADSYSGSDKKIIIDLRQTATSFVLQIKDQGRGIPKEDLDRIFDRFYRGGNISKEGMGLGLFLVKNIIKRHHGEVKITTKENKGTTVRIKLPRIKL